MHLQPVISVRNNADWILYSCLHKKLKLVNKIKVALRQQSTVLLDCLLSFDYKGSTIYGGVQFRNPVSVRQIHPNMKRP